MKKLTHTSSLRSDDATSIAEAKSRNELVLRTMLMSMGVDCLKGTISHRTEMHSMSRHCRPGTGRVVTTWTPEIIDRPG